MDEGLSLKALNSIRKSSASFAAEDKDIVTEGTAAMVGTWFDHARRLLSKLDKPLVFLQVVHIYSANWLLKLIIDTTGNKNELFSKVAYAWSCSMIQHFSFISVMYLCLAKIQVARDRRVMSIAILREEDNFVS